MTSGFNYQEELSKCSTMEDITGPNGLVQRMVKDAIEQILQGEITDYITANGTPRMINKLCNASLLVGSSANLNIINADAVMQAINDCELG